MKVQWPGFHFYLVGETPPPRKKGTDRMLVLTRKEQESIMIGDDVEIVVVEIQHDNKVRIGITAPPDVAVHRREVYDAIKREKKHE